MSLKQDKSQYPTDGELKERSAYENTDKTKPQNTTKKSGKKRKSQSINASARTFKLEKQISDMKAAQERQRAATPTVGIFEDGIALVYSGRLEDGRPAQTREYISRDKEFAESVHSILKPLVSICNTALMGKALESRLAYDGPGKDAKPLVVDGKSIYHASALDKARIAYQMLAKNPEVIKTLRKLSNQIDQIMKDSGTDLGKMDLILKDKDKGIQPITQEEILKRIEAYLPTDSTEVSAESSAPDLPGE